MRRETLVVVVSVLLLACGSSSSSSKSDEVQSAVEAVASALSDKADECGLDVDPNARFECDASVTDAKGLRACAASIAPLTCDFVESLSDGEPESDACAPFEKVCGVR